MEAGGKEEHLQLLEGAAGQGSGKRCGCSDSVKEKERIRKDEQSCFNGAADEKP